MRCAFIKRPFTVSGNLGTPFFAESFSLFALRNKKVGGNFSFDDPGNTQNIHAGRSMSWNNIPLGCTSCI